MKMNLKRIKPQARSLVVLENYGSQPEGIYKDYIETFERDVNLEPLLFMLAETLKRFERENKVESDGWLAPRIHASLRLYRREAADISIWEYLSLTITEVQKYIKWRWGDENGQVQNKDRIFGRDRRHGLARLWWTAELTRNGSDYSTTIQAFKSGSQDLINYLTDVDFSHNRAAAIAYIHFFTSESEHRKAKESKEIGKALNHVLTTIMLDDLVPNPGTDTDAYQRWVSQTPDETLMLDELPKGPNEPKIETEKINKVIKLLESLEIQPV